MEPTQVVVEIAGGDAAAGTQEVLQPTVATVHRLHMQIAPNPFPHRAVECFVAHPERGGARWVARAAVGDQQGVLRDHRIEGSRERRRIDPGGSTALTVVPLRSAAMRTGTCSREKPRFFALPPRRRALRPSPRAPFRLSRT